MNYVGDTTSNHPNQTPYCASGFRASRHSSPVFTTHQLIDRAPFSKLQPANDGKKPLPRPLTELRFHRMTAVEIISEIEHLPPSEKTRVIQFVRSLDEAERLSGAELTRLAEEMTQTSDPVRAGRLKDEITKGFYGTGNRA